MNTWLQILYINIKVCIRRPKLNHIADYEVPFHVSCSSLVSNISSTKIFHFCQVHIYGILLLCNLIIKSYLFWVVIWTLYHNQSYLCQASSETPFTTASNARQTSGWRASSPTENKYNSTRLVRERGEVGWGQRHLWCTSRVCSRALPPLLLHQRHPQPFKFKSETIR